MESPQDNSCSVIQYYKGTGMNNYQSTVNQSDSLITNDSVEQNINEVLGQNNGGMIGESTSKQIPNHDSRKGENNMDFVIENIKEKDIQIKKEIITEEGMGFECESTFEKVAEVLLESSHFDNKLKLEPGEVKIETDEMDNIEMDSDEELFKKGRKRRVSDTPTDGESSNATNPYTENVEAIEGSDDSDYDDEEEMENKPRKRGRCKKNPDIIPSHLSSDVVLGYKILLKFLETPQFSGFHKPFKRVGPTENDDMKITCLNQIKKKFDTNSYKNVSDFVNDVREMLINIYESRNPVATKRALRLEQILEQRIAQLPNYLRPQCALILPPDEINNLNKIRISKGGGFVSLLLEKTEKERSEKNREKRKLLAEERKQLKEEQDKDVQDWEKNVLLKDVEEEIKSMWELPAIGHFIHLCSDLLKIGEVAQYEIERMLLMPQCSETLDLVMTSLLTNSLVRAKLDRTPPMPYSIWEPLVRTRVVSWYRLWHRESKNEQKLFEEIGVEPDFWQVLGPDENPFDFICFHELSLFQRVWVLKTLCDVDFIKKKTVHDNIRAQPLEKLNPIYLGVDRHGNRYLQFKLFGTADVRIYRQNVILDDDITPSELVESHEGFEERAGAITTDKVFKDIWDLGEKPEVKCRRKKTTKHKKERSFPKVVPTGEKKNLRKSVRAKQKTYVYWSDSDGSDTDLKTLRKKLKKSDPTSLYRPASDREFISLSVFRLPREKVNTRATGKRNSTATKKTEDNNRNEGATNDKTTKLEQEEKKEDAKPGCEDEQSDSSETKPNQETQNDFDKSYHGDDDDESEEKEDKLSDKTTTNKGDSGDEASVELNNVGEDIKAEKDVKDLKDESSYKYNIPNHLKPDSNKFYLVVDSVEGLRQLISKFGSHENDLEIISRSTKMRGKKGRKSPTDKHDTSCEVKLLERLQTLLVEVEPLEFDLIKSFRSSREKMYKEYINFINRPPDFVHPNESYWMKNDDEPASSTSSTTTTTTTTSTAADGTGGNADKSSGKENVSNAGESVDPLTESLLNDLVPRKRTRVTRVQLQPDNKDSDEDTDDMDDCESTGSDDVWVLPTPKKKVRKEATPKTPRLPRRNSARRSKSSPSEKGESQSTTGEKSHSTPEKAKKALFWGQRGSDPSEDLHWETNRQKILEQHNSPIKKLFGQQPEESNPQNAFHKKSEFPGTSVIRAPPKRYITPIPGNKKPYYSSAQLKAMDNQAKQRKLEEQQRILVGVNSQIQEVKTIMSSSVIETASPNKVQIHNKAHKSPKQSTAKVQSGARSRHSAPKPSTSRTDNTILHQTLTQPSQIKVQNSGLTNVIHTVGNSGIGCGVIQQNPIGQAQILQPIGRVQQIQIQQPSGQTRTVPGTVKIQQPIQWEPKVVTLQTIGHTGKVVQQQQQQQQQEEEQHQVHNQGHAQILSQGQLQQVLQIEPTKTNSGQSTVQFSAEKLATIQQMIQNQATQSGYELFIADGKVLIKLDAKFYDEYLGDNKIFDLSDKLDIRTPLFVVKLPKAKNPDQTNTEKTKTDETNTEETKTDETNTEQTNTDQTNTDQMSADQTYTDQTYADQTNMDEMCADLTYTDQTYADLTNADQMYADQTNTDQMCADQTYTDQTYADLTNTDQIYADLTNTDQTYADLTNADQMYADQTNADQLCADQTNTDQMYGDQTYADQTYTGQTYSDVAYTDQTYTDQSLQTISQSQPVPSTSQQNFLVISKPTCIQQNVVTSTVPNFVIPGNYIIKDNSQAQAQGSETQTVKIVQPASAYVIQQKPIVNKNPQPQIFKIITSQPIANSQNLLLSSANLNIGNQVICPVNQAIVAGAQQTRPMSALRFVRPLAVSSPGTTVPNNANLGQSPIIVNNTLQIQGQRVESPRPQAAIVGGRIVGTEVPSIRMAAPTMVPSSSPQTVRLVRNQNVQPIRLTTAVQSRQSPNQVAGTQPAALATVITAQPLRIATSLQGQAIVSSSTLNPQAVASMNLVQAIPSSSQHLITQGVVSSASLPPETGQKAILASQPVASSLIVQPLSTSSSFISGSREIETGKITQPVRNITSSQSESVLVSNAQPLRVVSLAQPQQIYTSAIISTGNTIGYVQPARGTMSTIVQTVRPTMSTIVQPTRSAIVQPIRLATGVRPQTFKIIQNNNPGIRFVNLNAACTKATVITNSAASPLLASTMNSQPAQVVTQPIRVQTIVKPGGVPRDGGLHSG